MAHSTQHVFDATAATYDLDRARLIPGFTSFYGWAVDLIPATAKTIADLGAGSGLLSAFVRARLPDASLHLIDISNPMLERARVRLRAELRVTFQHADYSTAALPEALDAFVSALSIHHLEHQAQRGLFERIYRNLNPGGVFVNAEQVLGPTPEVEARYKAIWLEQVRALGASGEQIADSLFRQQEDRCAPVEDQLAWMRAAGFTEVDCWFKHGRFAVFAGTKDSRARLGRTAG